MRRTTRRDFALLLGTAAALPLLPTAATAQKTPPPATEKPAEETPEPPNALGLALGAVVAARYGEHLSGEAMQSITRELSDGVSSLERLRSVELRNSDEPDFAFAVVED